MLCYAALAPEHGRLIVPATTYAATANAGLIQGYKLFLKDLRKNDFVIDETGLDKFCLPTDIVTPVHLFGYPAPMDRIMAVAKKKKFAVIEDCCQAHGTMYKGKKVGSWGDAGCFSFYVSHNIGAGEMGCITTDNKELNDKVRLLKDNGRDDQAPDRFWHKYVGFNAKTTEFSAALAYAQVKDADEIKLHRWETAVQMFKGIKHKEILLPDINPDNSIMSLPLGVKKAENRIKFLEALRKVGVETREMFPCLANQPSLKNANDSYQYVRSNDLEHRYFYIPLHQYLTDEQKKLMIKTINKVKI